MHALSLIPLGVLLLAARISMLFLLKDPADAAKLGEALASANKGVLFALTIAFAVVALQIVWHAGKIVLESYRKRVAA